MNVLEWLIHRGAKKIIIFTESKTGQNNLNRRLSLFHKYFNADVVVPQHKITSEEGVFQLFNESSMYGPIDAVFIVPNESGAIKPEDQAVTKVFVEALRKVAPAASLINFVPTVAGICQAYDDGFKSYSIELIKDGDIRQGLNALNQIVPSCSSHTIMLKTMERRQNIIGKNEIIFH